jgi:WD40 repeat protein/tRNA A-37 threonylcarbamoyl transferase component Bud32
MLGITLSSRYKIVKHLGGGGFGQTYLAEDLQLPGNPLCVVKQLHPQSTDPLTLQVAKRLFDREAQVLYQLGNHDQIPRLLAHFEENQEFYLVQEFIEGHDLKQELPVGLRLNETQVIALCQELLTILEFVHDKGVIHRDIKPANIIRRKQDGKLVLIDFGAVKQVATQTANSQKDTSLTVAIGSPGYMPNEQLSGKPQFCSDIYAVGMLGIQALTGLPPSQLPSDAKTSEILWRDKWQHDIPAKQVAANPHLADVLDTMVRYDYRQRYQTATEALQALQPVTLSNSPTVTVSSDQDTTTSFADPSEATVTYSPPQVPGSLSRSPLEMEKPTQAPPSQELTPDASATLSEPQVGHEVSESPVSTSRSLPTKPIAIGTGLLATAVALTVGLYHFHQSSLSASESQWAQKIALSKTLTGNSTSVNPVAISPDGKTLVSGGEGVAIQLWDLQTGTVKNTLEGHSSAVFAIAFSRNGQILASGSADHTISLWNPATGQQIRKLSGQSKGISAIAMSPDSQTLVSGDRVGTIEIWNLSTGERINVFSGHDIWVTSLAISPDGQTLVSSSQDNKIKLWELKTGKLTRTLTSPDSHHVFSIAISPDGRTIASGSWDGGIRLWDVGTGNLIQTLRVGSAGINSVTFRSSGQTLISGGADGVVRLWDLRTGKPLRTLTQHSQAVNALAISPDGKTLVSSSQDKTIGIWRSP